MGCPPSPSAWHSLPGSAADTTSTLPGQVSPQGSPVLPLQSMVQGAYHNYALLHREGRRGSLLCGGRERPCRRDLRLGELPPRGRQVTQISRVLRPQRERLHRLPARRCAIEWHSLL